jgi:DNA-binding NarL/FixJ family response regulator
VIGLGLPGPRDAYHVIRAIREHVPTCPVLACGRDATAEEISRALLVGADGYVDEECDPVEFVQAVRAAAVGEMLLAGVPVGILGGIADGLDRPPSSHRVLTERELQVLVIASRGLTARQIARQLGVRERTVTTHLANIYSKLEVGTRVAAVMKAANLGLIKIDVTSLQNSRADAG